MCECGKKGSISVKSHHFKSIFHKQDMERVKLVGDSTTPITTIDDDADTYFDCGICRIPLDLPLSHFF
jgi:hypothetical protein